MDAFCRHFYCLNTDVQYTGRRTASNSCDCPLRQQSIVTSISCIFPCDQFVNLSHFVSFLKSIDISMDEAMVSQGFHKHRSQGDNILEIYLLEGGQFVRFLKSIEISKEAAAVFQGFHTNLSHGDNLFELSLLEG